MAGSIRARLRALEAVERRRREAGRADLDQPVEIWITEDEGRTFDRDADGMKLTGAELEEHLAEIGSSGEIGTGAIVIEIVTRRPDGTEIPPPVVIPPGEHPLP